MDLGHDSASSVITNVIEAKEQTVAIALWQQAAFWQIKHQKAKGLSISLIVYSTTCGCPAKEFKLPPKEYELPK
jgi:hypothetical protein